MATPERHERGIRPQRRHRPWRAVDVCRVVVAAALVAAAVPATALAGSSDPALAVGSAGTAHMAWVSDQEDGGYVQERRRSPGGIFTPRQYVSLSDTVSWMPAIGSDSQGNAVLAWEDYVPGTTSTAGLLTRRRGTDGSLGPIQRIRPATSYRFTFDMAVNGAGDAVYAWTLKSGGATVVQVRRRLANGTLSATKTVSPTTGGIEWAPQVTLDGAGNAVVAWLYRGSSSFALQARTSKRDGTLGPLQTVATAVRQPFPGADDPVAPFDMATRADGRTAFAWERPTQGGNQILSRLRAPDGTLAATQALTTATTSSFQPTVALAPTGRAVFGWVRDGAAFQARARTDEGALGAVFTVDTGSVVDEGDVEIDANGNAVFVSVGYDSAQDAYVLHTSRRTSAGVMSARQDVSAMEAGYPRTPQLGLDGSGNATIMWAQNVATDAGNASAIFVRRRTTTGELSEIQRAAG